MSFPRTRESIDPRIKPEDNNILQSSDFFLPDVRVKTKNEHNKYDCKKVNA